MKHLTEIRNHLIQNDVKPVYLGTPSDLQGCEGVWVIPTGGPTPERMVACAGFIPNKSVQILVRGRTNDFQFSYELASKVQAIFANFSRENIIDTQLQNSDPLNAGLDAEHRQLFTVNLLTKTNEGINHGSNTSC